MPRDPELETMLTQPHPDDDLGVQAYLDRFAEALTEGDGEAIAKMWQTPAYVLGAEMARVVNTPEEVAEFFGGAREQYNAMGVTDTKAEIVRLDEISDRLVMVRVHWPWLDADDNEIGGETSTYTLAREGDGDWKLRVAVMHGQEAVN
jgi:ketosteroid isomerase-like protein